MIELIIFVLIVGCGGLVYREQKAQKEKKELKRKLSYLRRREALREEKSNNREMQQLAMKQAKANQAREKEKRAIYQRAIKITKKSIGYQKGNIFDQVVHGVVKDLEKESREIDRLMSQASIDEQTGEIIE